MVVHSTDAHDKCEALHMTYKPVKGRDSYPNGMVGYIKEVVIAVWNDVMFAYRWDVEIDELRTKVKNAYRQTHDKQRLICQ